MSFAELLILAIGVSMDALAVAMCKGLSIQKLKLRHALIVGAWFGVFQALMPTIGWLLGSAFSDLITAVDHWVAFVLLGIIGGNMIGGVAHLDPQGTATRAQVATMLMRFCVEIEK